MSWVANVLLSVSNQEDPSLVEGFSEWLRDDAPWNGPSVPPGATGVGFLIDIRSAQGWGGWKGFEACLYGGTTNHADVGAIVEKFASVSWTFPRVVQLMIEDQEQDFFRLWMIVDGRVRLLTPVPPAGCDDLEM